MLNDIKIQYTESITGGQEWQCQLHLGALSYKYSAIPMHFTSAQQQQRPLICPPKITQLTEMMAIA
jgi:hypothetical protein